METTITISDWNAGTYLCTTTTVGTITNVTYSVSENVTLTN
jgi:hypothetical protein